ncbi:hypothetical protein BV509_17305 [Rhodovulum sulfidophilum]|uniref:SseB family protein n=1 Tax=Rhodovulum visakhapatnamense TaxID=364297 RepID=A0ABS1RKG0_9RHOB|nr:SseB family protein [Rhodovulum visakhapatnamense]MBL3571688.1 SseB family protein [Rhodovulum visakhapatnamense]MBL3580131.1 SseB family protein [Rhodovulum visakhapatnamense]OLS45940.1 hypothetical protein BV509_17305 [Rhodovulum sulfidophilum]
MTADTSAPQPRSRAAALDRAHAAMTAAPDDPGPRLAYYGRLAASELVLLLDRDAEDDRIAPRIFDLDEGRVVLAFADEGRLTDFTGTPSPYAAMPGRTLAAMLAGTGLGLGVDLGTGAGELLPAAAVEWWAGMLAATPEPLDLVPEALTPPGDLPAPLLAALDTCLADAAGLAACAWLAGLRHPAGETTLLLAFLDPAEGAEPALARAVSEAVRFSGLDSGALDLAFFASQAPMAARLSRLGLRIELPQPAPETLTPLADPDAPPRLR